MVLLHQRKSTGWEKEEKSKEYLLSVPHCSKQLMQMIAFNHSTICKLEPLTTDEAAEVQRG